MTEDERFMRRALTCARKAAQIGEVPVGAVLVKDGRVIASGYNRRETDKSALAHAEILAIRRACSRLGGWRLPGCTLYVTLEPCPMCAGAILNARIERVCIGAADPKAGAFGSVVNLAEEAFNHKPIVEFGYLPDACAGILTDFFRTLRSRRK